MGKRGQIGEGPIKKTRARRTTGAKGRKSNKAIIRFQKFDRSLNEIRNQC